MVGGVMDAGVEVGVVADRHRDEELGLLHRQEMPRQVLLVALDGEELRDSFPQLSPGARPGGGEPVQIRAGVDAERGEIEDLVADGHAASRVFLRALAAEDAERQVLDREVARGIACATRPSSSAQDRGLRLKPSHTLS